MSNTLTFFAYFKILVLSLLFMRSFLKKKNMKKLIFFLLAVFIFFHASAQRNTEIKPSQLPKVTTDFIKGNLPNSTIFKAIKVVENGSLTYTVGVIVNKNKHLYIFDQDGKFLKKGDNREGARIKENIEVQPQIQEEKSSSPSTAEPNQVQTKGKTKTIQPAETKQLIQPQPQNQTKKQLQAQPQKESKKPVQPSQQSQTKHAVESVPKK